MGKELSAEVCENGQHPAPISSHHSIRKILSLRVTLLLTALLFISTAKLSHAEIPPPILDASFGAISEFDISFDGRKLTWIAQSNNEQRVYYRDIFSTDIHIVPLVPGLPL